MSEAKLLFTKKCIRVRLNVKCIFFDNLVTEFSAGVQDSILFAMGTWSEMDATHVFFDKLVAVSVHLKSKEKNCRYSSFFHLHYIQSCQK